MSRPAVLPIQRVMADATPNAWRDGIAVETRTDEVVVTFLDGGIAVLRVADAGTLVSVGDPVAHHPVAEILSVGAQRTTARAV